MEYNFPSRMKRKELEDVNDDFTDFSLNSPARKIRRLEAELPPIVEEEEVNPIPLVPEFASSYNNSSSSSGGVKIEELPSEPVNEERAIVLLKSVNSCPLLHSPSSFSISVNPDLISGFKNQVLWSNQSNSWRVTSDQAMAEDDTSGSSNGCLDVVPWVPSQLPSTSPADVSSQLDKADTMDADDMEVESMDVEEEMSVRHRNVNEASGMGVSEGLKEWKKHCMIPQPPQNMTTPIVWYRY